MISRDVSTRIKLLLVLMALSVLSIPTSAQNDNCCYIDRQCVTNEEWVSGYYAFQNNECAAPSETNNCCFTEWACDSNADWNSGYYAFRQNQCNSQSQWEQQREARTANDGPTGNDNRESNSNSSRETVSVTVGPVIGPGPQEYETDDGVGIIIVPIRLTPEQYCELFPNHDRCQYPDSYD